MKNSQASASLVPTNAAGYYMDKSTRAIIHLNTEEKRIYDLQISLATMKNDMDELKSIIKTWNKNND